MHGPSTQGLAHAFHFPSTCRTGDGRPRNSPACDRSTSATQGASQQRDRWKRAIGATDGALGDAIGQLYVKPYFPASSTAKVEGMVSNILAAFRDGVDKLAWMSPETKKIAKAKADTMLVGVGYPDSWRD